MEGFPGGSDDKASVYNAGDPGLIPGSGRSSGKGNGNPLLAYVLSKKIVVFTGRPHTLILQPCGLQLLHLFIASRLWQPPINAYERKL